MKKTLLVLAGTFLLCSTGAFAAQDEYVRVEIKGVLHNDAQGHRATIHANGQVFDLDFVSNRNLYSNAERFDRSTVLVTGFINVEQSAAHRHWVDVDRIEEFRPVNTAVERREIIEERPVQERVIIKERRDPIFKAGPLEIRP